MCADNPQTTLEMLQEAQMMIRMQVSMETVKDGHIISASTTNCDAQMNRSCTCHQCGIKILQS